MKVFQNIYTFYGAVEYHILKPPSHLFKIGKTETNGLIVSDILIPIKWYRV